MCWHHWSRGSGHAPSENGTSYTAAAAIWDILKHTLKETILYFAAFAKMKTIYFFLKYSVMQTLHTQIKPKTKMKTMSLKYAF